ncbi:hypothetical protein B0H65DRAFT_477633 [Neurospora tetraspora]|uniref:Uncharacterized protein n=1 Tax=Neurospora tetraspora TaxID=94610 RepID=A0AAE0J6Z8_9PEZI|nr:hypothetical protein B0H65DRAFT_477633 [Neurospora tetraspora]
MKLISVLTALTAFKAATALPSGSMSMTDSAPHPTFSVSLYTLTNYTGNTKTITSKQGACIKVDDSLAYQVSSIKINQGVCNFYLLRRQSSVWLQALQARGSWYRLA